MLLIRGFVKYARATNQYRPPERRLEDWGEVYNHAGVMAGLRKQAARCVTVNVTRVAAVASIFTIRSLVQLHFCS